MRRKPREELIRIVRAWPEADQVRVRQLMRSTDWSPEVVLADPVLWQCYDLGPDEVPEALKPPGPARKPPYAELRMTAFVVTDGKGHGACGVTPAELYVEGRKQGDQAQPEEPQEPGPREA